jgi:DNA-binding transcriptional LysR family regulator
MWPRLANTVQVVAGMVTAGLGLGLLPDGLARGEITRIAPGPTATNGIWLLYHEDLRPNLRVRALADHLAVAVGLTLARVRL